MDTEELTISPSPPVQGGKATLCHTGGGEVTIECSWSPDNITEPPSIKIPAGETCVEFTVPTGATSVIFHDTSGRADDLATMIAI